MDPILLLRIYIQQWDISWLILLCILLYLNLLRVLIQKQFLRLLLFFKVGLSVHFVFWGWNLGLVLHGGVFMLSRHCLHIYIYKCSGCLWRPRPDNFTHRVILVLFLSLLNGPERLNEFAERNPSVLICVKALYQAKDLVRGPVKLNRNGCHILSFNVATPVSVEKFKHNFVHFEVALSRQILGFYRATNKAAPCLWLVLILKRFLLILGFLMLHRFTTFDLIHLRGQLWFLVCVWKGDFADRCHTVLLDCIIVDIGGSVGFERCSALFERRLFKRGKSSSHSPVLTLSSHCCVPPIQSILLFEGLCWLIFLERILFEGGRNVYLWIGHLIRDFNFLIGGWLLVCRQLLVKFTIVNWFTHQLQLSS